MARRKPMNGVHVEPWWDPKGGIGYRTVRYVKGVLTEVIYSEVVLAGSPSKWLQHAQRNCILARDREIVKLE